MPKEFNPYLLFIGKWMTALDSCRRKKNPAWWLYKNDARTTLFMLQAIARIMYKAELGKHSNKWRKIFKRLEDMLGQIDYYDVMLQNFSKNKSISEKELDYFRKKRTKAITKMNEDLKENGYYSNFLITFNRQCNKNFNDKDLIKTLEGEIKLELDECYNFFKEFPDGFTNMETQVHEQRRKLRWISIYGQALGGIIRLKNAKKKYKWEKEFVSAKIKNSPFNILPENKELKQYINLNKTAYYGLSYMIQELGRIKDEGLNIEALAKAISKTDKRQEDAYSEAHKKLHSATTIKELLQQAWKLLHKFYVSHKMHKELTRA